LTRGRRLPGSLWRFAVWQIKSRLFAREHVVPWIGSSKLAVRQGMTGATGNIYAGLHEYEEMAFVAHLLRPGDLFADIGANVGSYSVLAGVVVGADVIAFEPHPASVTALRRNIEINGAEKRIKVHQAAVGAVEATLRMTAELDTVNHLLAEGESGASIDVPVVTLEGALSKRSPSVMKIDVEGWEHEVLAGASRLLKDPTLLGIVIELNGSGRRYGFEDQEIDRLLLDSGFERCKYDPMQRLLRAAPETVIGAGNVIYARTGSEVRERLATAPPLKVLGVTI
jgi:FkbM family methyltransferase